MNEMYETPGIAQMVEREWKKWLLLTQQRALESKAKILPTVTVSREKGSGGSSIAKLVAEQLGFVVFDREIVDEVARLAFVDRLVVEHMDEHSRRSIKESTDRVVRRQSFPPEAYMAHLAKTILTIGEKGGAVVVGRGAHLLLSPEKCSRVRVVAPLEVRVQRLCAGAGLERSAAESAIATTDRERARFIQENFQQTDANPLLYDLVINTGGLAVDAAADLVVRAVEAKFPHVTETAALATHRSPGVPERK
jgi:cytidylate kinase